MFAYCNNNPANRIDSDGFRSVEDDPGSAWMADLNRVERVDNPRYYEMLKKDAVVSFSYMVEFAE